MKRCRKCLFEKEISDFYKSRKFSDGLNSWCKACWSAYSYTPERKAAQRKRDMENRRSEKAARYRRDWVLKKKYGISLSVYEQMLVDQGGRCAICEIIHSDTHNGLYVDHCHTAKEVRSLLCLECNTGLGKFSDDPDMLERAASYLRKHSVRKLALIQGES